MGSEGFPFYFRGSGGAEVFAQRCFYDRNLSQPSATVLDEVAMAVLIGIGGSERRVTHFRRVAAASSGDHAHAASSGDHAHIAWQRRNFGRCDEN